MPTSDPERPAVRPQASSAPAGRRPAEFEAALRELAQALAERKVEPICTAYLELRQSGRGMPPKEILEEASRVDGQAGADLIVSAFSRRRCFMCEDGTIQCSTCEGSGVVNGRPCPGCDGQGVEVCPFCMGSGWSDEDQIPGEIRRQALRRRTAHLVRDVKKLAKLPLAQAVELAGGASAQQRRELTGWLLRLQARLARAAGQESGNGDKFAAACRTMSDRITKILEALRPKASAAPAQDEPA